MSNFESTIGPLLAREGGEFVTDDNGLGACKWGVTLSSYRAAHPEATEETIRAMTPEAAGEFYREEFWERYHIGLLSDQAVADKVMDLAVNCGGGNAVRMLQTVIGVKVDYVLGPRTAAVANSLQPSDLIGGLRIAAAERYRSLAATDPAKYGGDLAGWLARNETV